jgi:hypothetical protein
MIEPLIDSDTVLLMLPVPVVELPHVVETKVVLPALATEHVHDADAIPDDSTSVTVHCQRVDDGLSL